MNISHELLNEYVASQGLTLFAQQKENDRLKEELAVLEHKHRASRAEVGDRKHHINVSEGENGQMYMWA